MSLNTKDIKTGGGIPKLLQPGNYTCKINGIQLEEFKFKPGSYHIMLYLEGPDLGSDFEGFFIDKNDETRGRYKGQIGQVKASEWAFADGETKSGVIINRDDEILKFMKNLCIALDCGDWLTNQDGKHETIESLIELFDYDKPFKDKATNFCIAGKEYLNKGGYTNYELFLPRYAKTGAPFGKVKVAKFNEEDHIKRKKVETVAEFENTDNLGLEVGNDFSLEDDDLPV